MSHARSGHTLDGEVRGGAFQGGGIRLPLPPAPKEGPASLVLRPEHLAILREGAPGPAGAVRLEGTVRGREFLGSSIRYSVEAGGRLLLADGLHRRGEEPIGPGEAVALYLHPDQAIVLAG